MNSVNIYRNWKAEKDENGILWAHLDKADTSTNVLSADVLEELSALLKEYSGAEAPLGLVIDSAKSNGFIAGADIKEFTQIKDVEAGVKHIRRGQAVMDQIEALPYPSLALIHGFCLGGGFELALACTYRIADDGSKTSIGLPEVQLGIHPGFGGTMRLSRLVGAPVAMDLMLTGRSVDARKAKKMHLIDFAVPTRQIKGAAVKVLLEQPAPHRATAMQKLTNSPFVRPFLAHAMRGQVAKKARRDHYPAPFALIDLWAKHGGNPSAMVAAEAESVANLVIGDTAQNLVRVFLLREQLKALGKGNFEKVKNVHVIGAGVMGGDIAAWCALRGLNVTLQDRKPEVIAKALARAHTLFEKKLKEKRLVTAAMDRLMPDIKGLGIPAADVVIEAIIENIEAKQALYRSIEPQLKPDALLTTNTSSIPLEVLSTALNNPGRLVGLHFFNPVAQMPLIEIVSGTNTDPVAAQRAAAFAGQLDRLPLPVRSGPGFLVNRVLMPYMLEAVRLHEEGVPASAIDQAALDFGMPMGPLHLADTVGLDICLSVAEILAKNLDVKVPQSLRDKVKEGTLGAKTGSGFYLYDNGKKRETGSSAKAAPEIADRLIGRMLNESVACLREGVVANEDWLDAGIIFGTGFAPFRGGPLHHARHFGVRTMTSRLQELEQTHGSGFHPDDGWVKLA